MLLMQVCSFLFQFVLHFEVNASFTHLHPEGRLLQLRQSGPVWLPKAHRPAHFPVCHGIMSVSPRAVITESNNLSAQFSAATLEVCVCMSVSHPGLSSAVHGALSNLCVLELKGVLVGGGTVDQL